MGIKDIIRKWVCKDCKIYIDKEVYKYDFETITRLYNELVNKNYNDNKKR